MKLPKLPKLPISSIAEFGKKIGESEYFLPVLYFAGAAGGLAYGTYALVDHVRGTSKASAGKIAKIGLPVIVGSGLAVLGVRDLRAGKPLIAEMMPSAPRSRAARKGGRSGRRGRAAKAA
jgi:hypothetical protein